MTLSAGFAALAGLTSILVGWLVTARLFALARRTRALPERLLAIAFGGLFCIGYPLTGASRAPGLNLTTEGSLLFTIGTIGIVVGIAALGCFPKSVFRPGRRWSALLCASIMGSGLVGGIGCIAAVALAQTAPEMLTQILPWALLILGSIGVAFLWNAFESTLYYYRMKRRLTLGLAEPETTHRFLLWAIASGCAVALLATITTLRISGIPVVSIGPMTLIACSSLVTSTCWWLAFLMPDRYRRWVFGSPLEASEASD